MDGDRDKYLICGLAAMGAAAVVLYVLVAQAIGCGLWTTISDPRAGFEMSPRAVERPLEDQGRRR